MFARIYRTNVEFTNPYQPPTTNHQPLTTNH